MLARLLGVGLVLSMMGPPLAAGELVGNAYVDDFVQLRAVSSLRGVGVSFDNGASNTDALVVIRAAGASGVALLVDGRLVAREPSIERGVANGNACAGWTGLPRGFVATSGGALGGLPACLDVVHRELAMPGALLAMGEPLPGAAACFDAIEGVGTEAVPVVRPCVVLSYSSERATRLDVLAAGHVSASARALPRSAMISPGEQPDPRLARAGLLA